MLFEGCLFLCKVSGVVSASLNLQVFDIQDDIFAIALSLQEVFRTMHMELAFLALLL